MKDKRIDTLVFDMDGLLFDSEQIVKRSWNIAGEALGIGRIGEQIYHTIGMNFKSRTKYFYSVFGTGFPNDEFAVLSRIKFREIADKEGIPLKSGAKELLNYASGRDFRLAVATSSRQEYAERLLKDGGIYDYFGGFAFGDMVTNSKPDPEIYLAALKAVGGKPECAVGLEDSPNGIRSVYAARMCPVMVPDLVQPSEEILAITYRKVDSLFDVITLLEE